MTTITKILVYWDEQGFDDGYSYSARDDNGAWFASGPVVDMIHADAELGDVLAALASEIDLPTGATDADGWSWSSDDGGFWTWEAAQA